ncbi:MAG TPA: hypothetical protein VMU11_03020 [Verrucomicrobiae bacterium]|nr:hypothetical protein [Verrucomicrobiae bacterium]
MEKPPQSPKRSEKTPYNEQAGKIVMEALQKAGTAGITYQELLDHLEGHRSGDVYMEGGEEEVRVNVADDEWEDPAEYKLVSRPALQRVSIFDSDDLNDALEHFDDAGRARYDKATKKWFLI